MLRNFFFENFNDRFINPWKHQFLQGILFVLFGTMIIVFPQILAAMVASVFIMIGFLLISSAWAFKRMAREYRTSRNEYYDWY